MITESRIIAGLLLKKPSDAQWNESIVENNMLQKRSVSSATTLSSLIRRRLQTMPEPLWKLVVDGPSDVTRQALLAATVKHSPLLGDFMLQVVQDLYRTFGKKINPISWDRYVENCRIQDPSLPEWSHATIVNLRRTVFRILVEAGFLSDTKSLMLQRVFIAPDVLSCLKDHQETYALSCLQVSS